MRTNLVGFNARDFLVGGNGVPDLFRPRLQRTLADRVSHEGNFNSFLWRTEAISVSTLRENKVLTLQKTGAVELRYPSRVTT